MTLPKTPNSARLDQVVADARRNADQREKGYREQALKMYPWVCGRCTREFVRENLQQLTVHHRDHNHSNNPANGSNWELLCVYCHENEHARQLDAAAGGGAESGFENASHNPFANLKSLLKKN